MAKKGEAGSFDAGYKHGCSDAKPPASAQYINQPGFGLSNHSAQFMSGYNAGYNMLKYRWRLFKPKSSTVTITESKPTDNHKQ